jgi:hypothetical protein
MKKVILIVLVLAGITIANMGDAPQSPGNRVSTTTIQQRAKVVATVTADAAEPNEAERTWTTAKTYFKLIPVEWSNISLSFYGYGDGTGDGDPNGATFSFSVYVCDYYSGWEKIADCSGVIGLQRLSHNPVTGAALVDPNSSYKWCDTITEVTQYTDLSVIYSDYEGNNGLAKMYFDRRSAYGLYVRIYSMTSSTVTSITCVANGFN